LLIGLVSFTKLSVREYPKIDEPVVTVSVRYVGRVGRGDGVAGHQAAGRLHRRHRRGGRDHLHQPRRASPDHGALPPGEGRRFGAAAEVRDRTSRVRNRLPQAVDEPVIAKVEADAFPVIWLSFTSDTMSGCRSTTWSTASSSRGCRP
jgi:multidrug efflux pump